MQKLILCLFIVNILIVQKSQAISFIVRDSISDKPIDSVQILLTDNSLSSFDSIHTNAKGLAQLNKTRLSNFTDINIRFSHWNNAVLFYHLKSTDINSDKTIVIKLPKFLKSCLTFPTLKYEANQIEPDDIDKEQLYRIVPDHQGKNNIGIKINIKYSREEINGYTLSIKRANIIALMLLENGWNANQIYIQLKENNGNYTTIDFIWFNQ